MGSISKKVEVIEGVSRENVSADCIDTATPKVFKGLVDDWAVTKCAGESPRSAINYLKGLSNGKPCLVNIGHSGINGRYFYNEDMTGLNYDTVRMSVDEALDLILANAHGADCQSVYLTSNTVDTHFPQFRNENDTVLPRKSLAHETYSSDPRIWIGTRSIATCHYDALDNIACVVGGRRRFTLFPPEQFENLYFGPLELTPGGQPISLVDFSSPDYERFPRFKVAEQAGLVAELEPGDAIYIPSMWMHHVEGLSDFNILINYWWDDSPKFTGAGVDVLLHAILTLRHKPEHEKRAWRHLFDYYIFGDSDRAREHIPEHARGILDSLDSMSARQLRAKLLNRLNR